jgi:hypothetical protein
MAGWRRFSNISWSMLEQQQCSQCYRHDEASWSFHSLKVQGDYIEGRMTAATTHQDELEHYPNEQVNISPSFWRSIV